MSRRGTPCADCAQPINHDLATVSYCRECWNAHRREAQARYRKNNRDKVNAYNREWARAHPEAAQRQRAKQQAEPKPPPERWPDWISLAEAGRVLGVSRQRIDRLQRTGKLPLKLTRAAVEAYRQQRESERETP